MREIRTVNISQIVHGPLPMNRKVMGFALDMLVVKYIFPPVEVVNCGDGRYKLSNGRHRLAAHKLLEKKTIRVRTGSNLWNIV